MLDFVMISMSLQQICSGTASILGDLVVYHILSVESNLFFSAFNLFIYLFIGLEKQHIFFFC